MMQVFRVRNLSFFCNTSYWKAWSQLHKADHSTAPSHLYSLNNVFLQTCLPDMTPMKKSRVKYSPDVDASQQGWEELDVVCGVDILRHWSLQSFPLRIWITAVDGHSAHFKESPHLSDVWPFWPLGCLFFIVTVVLFGSFTLQLHFNIYFFVF